MWTKAFWKGAVERAIATFAETVLALAGVDALGWAALDWVQILIAGGVATGLSVLKSLAAGAKDGNPSVGSAEVTVPDGTGEHRATV